MNKWKPLELEKVKVGLKIRAKIVTYKVGAKYLFNYTNEMIDSYGHKEGKIVDVDNYHIIPSFDIEKHYSWSHEMFDYCEVIIDKYKKLKDLI